MTTGLGKSVFAAVKWTEAMQGAEALNVAIDHLAGLLGVDFLLASRITWSDSKQKRLAIGFSDGTVSQCPLGAGRALTMFGDTLRSARDNTIWSLTDVGGDTLSRHGSIEIAESVVLCLHCRKDVLDVLELHFLESATRPNLDQFKILAPELAGAWRRRLPGVVQRHLQPVKSSILHKEFDTGPLQILHPDNPMGLSRSEFRICMLFSDGCSTPDIAKKLRISVPTVRSHFSRIFSKTNTAGQVELINTLHRDKLDMSMDKLA